MSNCFQPFQANRSRPPNSEVQQQASNMSRVVHIGSTRDPKPDPLHELDIDELVERLSASEIQKLLDECDPDDPHIPPSMRNNYKCEKEPTGPLDKKKLNGENASWNLLFCFFSSSSSSIWRDDFLLL